MKRHIAILLSVVALGTVTATAQNIRIDSTSITMTPTTLDIDLSVKASDIELKCNGMMTLELAIESEDRRLVLPVVVYSSKQRYRYEQRKAALTNSYNIEPYHTYKGVKKNRSYTLDYRLSIPYYSWMEHASITYRQYTHDCSGDNMVASNTTIQHLNPAPAKVEQAPVVEQTQPLTTATPVVPVSVIPVPVPLTASPKENTQTITTIVQVPVMVSEEKKNTYSGMVSFLTPQIEDIKLRASIVELNIGFPVNTIDIRPGFGDNGRELRKADSLINTLTNNHLVSISGVTIHGYASPEGKYSINERLAKERSAEFRNYLAGAYPDNEYLRRATIRWTGEDWEGLERLVRESDLHQKQAVLDIITDGSLSPDDKERALQWIEPWSKVYKPMLEEMYPKLRRIELRVDYTVQKFNDNKAREILYTNPTMLSLEEIYRVARYYEPGSKQYREVYEIAATLFPDDEVANNNAAAALLQAGDAQGALHYLRKVGNTPSSYNNYGVYHYIMGDNQRAKEYFTKAKNQGNVKAEQNLQLITADEE